jgi:hypothetical protein
MNTMNTMNTYETSAIVQEQGRILVADVPFAPGTEVEVTVSPKSAANGSEASAEVAALAVLRTRMKELFATVKGFRNVPRLRREELYERGSLR